MTDTSQVVTSTTGFWKRTWRLTWPYLRSDEWKIAWALLIAVIALTLAQVYLSVQFNDWRRDFYNMLNTKDLHQTPVMIGSTTLFTINHFLYIIGKFSFLAVFWVLVGVYGVYLQQILQLRWRRWVTRHLADRWMANRAFYRLQLQNYGTENPEQRIEADVMSFTQDTLDLSINLINNLVSLLSFSVVLWNISGAVSLSLGVTDITIPGYMLWAALLYSAIGTFLAFVIGKQLVPANFLLEKLNADFRFRMMRIRENSESIALYGGEARESTGVGVSFQRVWNQYWRYMILTKRLNWFQLSFAQLAVIFPYLMAAPKYFAGAFDVGTLFQIADAFGEVRRSLSWFVTLFDRLAAWKATTNRLSTFVDALERAESDARQQALVVEPQDAGGVELDVDDIRIPTGRILLHDVDIDIPRVASRLVGSCYTTSTSTSRVATRC
jgi:putative ATP-binding cassette transporter